MNNLKEKYNKSVGPELRKKFGYNNIMAVPRLSKVVINVGTGRLSKEEKTLERMARDLSQLSGQKPLTTKSKQSIASFKVRQGAPVGLKITLRGRRMYDFIERLVNIALPRTRDFRGIQAKNLDRQGSLNIGIAEHSIFPEIQYEALKDIFSLQITVVTTAQKPEEALELLKLLGFPFVK